MLVSLTSTIWRKLSRVRCSSPFCTCCCRPATASTLGGLRWKRRMLCAPSGAATTASSAATARKRGLFITESLDGINTRRFARGINTEDHPHPHRYSEGDDDGPGADDGRPVGGGGNGPTEDVAEHDAQRAAGDGDEHRFRQKLAEDVAAPGPGGAADADFAGALHHRGQHDVHDADAADQQRDGGDGDHDQGEDALRLLLL